MAFSHEAHHVYSMGSILSILLAYDPSFMLCFLLCTLINARACPVVLRWGGGKLFEFRKSMKKKIYTKNVSLCLKIFSKELLYLRGRGGRCRSLPPPLRTRASNTRLTLWSYNYEIKILL